MPLFTTDALRQEAFAKHFLWAEEELVKTARETARAAVFDIFLSHSYADAALILGLKLILESYGLTVYVDWINDPELNRSQVNVATADRLRSRMRQSRALLYADSGSAMHSKWMPWELGYADGYQSRVAIVPIVEPDRAGARYVGAEYLGLYPKVEQTMSGPQLVMLDGNRRSLVEWIRSRPPVLGGWANG